MKVLIIPTWYPNGNDKLMGVYHKEFASALAERKGMNVDMIYIDRQMIKHPFKYIFMKKNLVDKCNGYNTYIKRELDLSKLGFKLEIKHYTKKLEKLFIEYVKANGMPDIIHAQVTVPAGYAACKIGNKYNIPVVVTEHATYYERFFDGKYKKYGDYVLDNSYFTTVSQYMCDKVKSFNKKCDVLANLVSTKEFEINRKIITRGGVHLVTVVSLRKVKRIDDIMEAIKIIVEQKKIKDIKLTIVGDGFEEEYYKKRCMELNVENYVSFVGRKTKKEIVDILAENQIYIMSSEVESFGIPAIEALASGMPVIATKCLGPEEYIDDKCGKLINIGNPLEMADAILKVYQNFDKYDIKYMRSVARRYSAKSITDKAIKIYKKILNK